MTRQSTTPVLPVAFLESARLGGAPQRITLRRSVSMRAALGFFVLTAALAVFTCLAWHLGAWRALPLTLVVVALLALYVTKHERAQPAALKIGRDGLSAWDRGGSLLAQGRIAGCSQWSDRLLVLALVPDQGRSRALFLAADALPASVFRELAVLGRCGAGA
ncbi:protein YgfX [Paraburkholderia sp. IW21]|uniref:protein YgfX n=1 Tax=Paraburkholderia sp. IW21 TaxID=3242488 RepID=UPI0035207E01